MRKSTGSASGSCSGRNNCYVRNDCFCSRNRRNQGGRRKYYHCRNSRSAEHQSALCCGSDKLRYDAGTVQPVFEIVNGEMYYGNGLCESVTANDDASEFTLKLKDGLKWHDGQPITADDVVFTMQVLVDEAECSVLFLRIR